MLQVTLHLSKLGADAGEACLSSWPVTGPTVESVFRRILQHLSDEVGACSDSPGLPCISATFWGWWSVLRVRAVPIFGSRVAGPERQAGSCSQGREVCARGKLDAAGGSDAPFCAAEGRPGPLHLRGPARLQRVPGRAEAAGLQRRPRPGRPPGHPQGAPPSAQPPAEAPADHTLSCPGTPLLHNSRLRAGETAPCLHRRPDAPAGRFIGQVLTAAIARCRVYGRRTAAAACPSTSCGR